LGLLASEDNEDLSTASPNLNQFLERIRASEIIFTDRLHVVVAAVLLGKQVEYLDPRNRKISNYIEFNFESDFKKLVRPANPAELLRLRIVREI
jgi:exopolysaccharide biosynthesis predicted pyruvyltransferase EpsI